MGSGFPPAKLRVRDTRREAFAPGGSTVHIRRVDRRTFAATLAGAVVGVVRPAAARQAATWPRHWVWVHGGAAREEAEWRRRFARLAEAGFGGVLVLGGETAALGAAARAVGVAFHRWILTLNRSGDRWVKEQHPEWFTVSREGRSSLEHPPYQGYYQWLCPTRADVRAYVRAQVAAIAADPGVDGVHLDYVRHADVILPRALWARYGVVQDRELPPYDFCYCDVCRRTFRERTGRDPLALADPASDAAWRRFRWEGVTQLVRESAAAAHGAGKALTAAVFPTPAIARQMVRQAWEDWPLDAVFPMLYHRFYERDVPWIAAAVREGIRALPRRRPLHAGLFVPDLPPPELVRAVELVLAAGARGICCFEAENLTDEHLARVGALLRRG